MKQLPVICVFCMITLASCEEEKASAPAMNKIKELPGKERAAKAAENVRPGLERDLAAVGLKFGDPVFIRAFKEEKQLDFYVRSRASQKFELFRTYLIAGASGILGPKLAEGDFQVPEGFYSVPPRAMNPDSQFHLALNIGYPNEFDLAYQRTGSFIMIHGNCVSIGCLAMTDEKIDEIYTLCDAAHNAGQHSVSVHIFPFRMTEARVRASAGDPNEGFWKNLREGYDWFNNNHLPPEVSVEGGKYVFKIK